MLFNSIYYIVFLTSVLIGLLVVYQKKYQHLILLIASYFFFFVSSNIYILLLYLASFSSYYIGIAVYRSKNKLYSKIWLILACVILLGTLGYFKYINFALFNINYIFFSMNIVPPFSQISVLLPIGISFYTFEALIYVIDIYRGTINPADSIRDYLLYMAFFPKLIAGPIVRAWEFLPQLKNRLEFTLPHAQLGVTLILWGLFKKVVIADNIGKFVDIMFTNPISSGLTSFNVWSATFAFGIQLFCDFSGYTDIAIGTALIMGIYLPQNFNRPYFSRNPAIFWRNWNITLSRLIKDYIYIPLGGSRKGKVRTYLNLLIAWMLSGLWHGAAWNFVLWGGYQGLLLVFHKMIIGRTERVREFTSRYSTIFVSVLVTQYFIFLGWIFFRVRDPNQIAYCVYRYIVPDMIFSANQAAIMLFSILAVVIIWFLLRTGWGSQGIRRIWDFDHIAWIGTLKIRSWFVCCLIIGIIIISFGPDAAPQFIYMRF